MIFINKLILSQVAVQIESTEKDGRSDDLIETPGGSLMLDSTRNGRKVNRF